MKVLWVLAASVLAVQPPQTTPVLRILEPDAETIVTGPVTFRVGITGGELQRVVFQVDGVEACRAEGPPYTCTWNAGPRLAPRVVRAIATLTDGRRVTAAVRTKGVQVSDRSEVVSILVSTHVTDDRGRFVPGLEATDFRILEDGVEQNVVLLDAGDGGAEVLVALDISGSMAPNMSDLKDVVRDFLGRLRAVDTVTLAGFNSAFFIIAPRDADRGATRQAIEELGPSGGTAIYDSMISGAELIGAQPGRRAVVLFTDGDDISSRATLEAARAALHANDCLLYLVATGKADSDVNLRKRLRALAVETGGGAYFSGRLSGATGYFRDIVQDLSQQYLLSFAPARPLGDGKWRALTVQLRDRSLRVRARSGYLATKRGG